MKPKENFEQVCKFHFVKFWKTISLWKCRQRAFIWMVTRRISSTDSKVESPYKTPSSTLAVKGLKSKHSFVNSLLISTLCHSISWLYRQVLSLLTRPYSLKAADQEFAFQTSLFQAGITIFSNLWTFISCFFFFFAFFVCFYSVVIVKTENRNSQPRIESADLRLCHRSRLGLLSIIALTILRKRNFGRLVCDNGCLPFIKKFRKVWLGFFGR